MQVNIEFLTFVAVFIFGAILGSFLNVVLYRLHTGRSLNGRSHCMSCGTTLRWHELLPLVSYILQLGRCKRCFSYIPSRYLLVELLTGCVFAALWYAFPLQWLFLFLYSALALLLILILVYDIRHTIIPDELTIGVVVVAFMFGVYEAYTLQTLVEFGWRFVGAFATGIFFWGLWYISKGRWIGLGDAKLGFPLAFIVGLGGSFSMVVLSFWIGAGISVTLLLIEYLLQRGKVHLHFMSVPLTIKSEVPFAPFLISGFILVHFFHADIFTITYRLFF